MNRNQPHDFDKRRASWGEMQTVILPCAGKGTRLGLPYPKEIHRIMQSHSLIDFSLDHIASHAGQIEHVVTVLAPGKETVFDYVQDRFRGGPPVTDVYFNERYSEWPGSIKSAEEHFGERNVALLPDSVLEVASGTELFVQFERAFDEGADLVFAYVPEVDRVRLSALGALCVQDGAVTGFCDKPKLDSPVPFNGFWASFGFTKACSKDVLNFMMRSVERQVVDIDALGLNVKAFPIERYTDLGTWKSVSEFIGSAKVLR